MGLFLEILGFIVAFLLFRLAVVKTFPVRKVGLELNSESKKALNSFRRRYLFFFWIFTSVSTILYVLGIHALFSWLHSSEEFRYVLILDYSSLFLPALAFGLLTGTILGKWINSKMQKDGLGFFFEGFQDEKEGFERNGFKLWQIIGVLVFGGSLLLIQFKSYIKVSDDQIFYRKSFSTEEKVYPKEVISSIEKDNVDQYIIFIGGSDTIDTRNFGGDKSGLMKFLRP